MKPFPLPAVMAHRLLANGTEWGPWIFRCYFSATSVIPYKKKHGVPEDGGSIDGNGAVMPLSMAVRSRTGEVSGSLH